MSSRGNGMMAVLHSGGKPGSLDDALDRIMLPSNDPTSPIPETQPPVEASSPQSVEGPSEKPEPAPRSRPKGKGSVLSNGILGELTAQKKSERTKVTLNTRIDDFIHEAIKKALRELEEAGYEDVTKEAIVNLSLVRGLNITPPEGWDVLES